MTEPLVIHRDSLPRDGSPEFVGEDNGGVGVSFILVDAAPGAGPSLHRHPYPEVFIVEEGEATFTVGDEQIVARAGDIVVAPANQWHGFVNSGEGRLRQIDIHPNGRFVTEWK